MAKRTPRTGAQTAGANPAAKPALLMEQHSGEGSASAMETMLQLESRRLLAIRPAEARPPVEDPDKDA